MSSLTTMINRDRHLHSLLFVHIQDSMRPDDAQRFRFLAEQLYLGPHIIHKCNNDTVEVLKALETKGVISVGNYTKLLNILLDSKLLKLYREVRIKGKEIEDILTLPPIGSSKSHSSVSNGVQPFQEHSVFYQLRLVHVKEQSDSWRKTCENNQIKFVTTLAYKNISERFSTNPCILIIGEEGEGKSSLLQKLSLDYASKGFLTLFAKEPGDIAKCVVPKEKILFIFDDPFGAHDFLQRKAEEWNHLGDLYFQQNLTSPDVKCIFACSRMIWNSCERIVGKLNIFRNIVVLSSSDLLQEERIEMLKAHVPSLSPASLHAVCLTSYPSFPKCCRLMSQNIHALKTDDDFVRFFCIESAIIQLGSFMRSTGRKWQYFALVSIMLNGGTLPCKEADLTREQQVMIKCVTSTTSDDAMIRIIESAERLVGNFITRSFSNDTNSERFEFLQSNLLEALALEYGRKDIGTFVKHCCASFMFDMLEITNKPLDIWKVNVPESFYNLFINRLFDVISQGEYDSVFRNSQLLTTNIQSRIIDRLSTDNSLIGFLRPDSEDTGNVLYRFIRTAVDDVGILLCKKGAKCSEFPRFHPLVALVTGHRYQELKYLLHKIKHSNPFTKDQDMNYLNNKNNESFRCDNKFIHPLRGSQGHHETAEVSNNGSLVDCLFLTYFRNLDLNVFSSVLICAICEALRQTDRQAVVLLSEFVSSSPHLHKSFGRALCHSAAEEKRVLVESVLKLKINDLITDECLLESCKLGYIDVAKTALDYDPAIHTIEKALSQAVETNNVHIFWLLVPFCSSDIVLHQAIKEGNILRIDGKISLPSTNTIHIARIALPTSDVEEDPYVINSNSETITHAKLPSFNQQSASENHIERNGDYHGDKTETNDQSRSRTITCDENTITQGDSVRTKNSNDVDYKTFKSYDKYGFSMLGSATDHEFEVTTTVENSSNHPSNGIQQTETEQWKTFVLKDRDAIKALLEINDERIHQFVSASARQGDEEMLDLIVSNTNNFELSQTAFEEASWGGHLTLVKYIYKESHPKSYLSKALINASRRNKINVVEYLLTLGPDGDSVYQAAVEASWVGNLEIIQMLTGSLSVDNRTIERLITIALQGGKTQVTTFLLGSFQIDKRMMDTLGKLALDKKQYCVLGKLLLDGASVSCLGLELSETDIRQTRFKKRLEQFYLSYKSYNNFLKASTEDEKEAFQGMIEKAIGDDDDDNAGAVLLLAVQNNDHKLLNAMLQKDLSEEVVGKALHTAVLANKIEISEMILSKCASQQAKKAALLSAAFRGNCVLVRLLCYEMPTTILEEAVLRASWSGKTGVVELLSGSLTSNIISEAISVSRLRGHTDVMATLSKLI